jgi:DNA polymerase-3 subunit gamma/tau
VKPEDTAHQTAPANGASAGAARSAGDRTPDADLVRERWPEILDAVRHRSKVAWAQLSNATVDTLQDGVLTLRFAQTGTATGFSVRRRSDEDLSRALEQVLGISPKIKTVSVAAREGSAGSRPAGASPPGARGGGAAPVGFGGDGADAAGPDPGGAGPGIRGAPGGGGAEVGEAGAGQAGAGKPGRTGRQAPRRDRGPAAPDRAAPGGPEEPDHDPEGSALTGMDLIQRTLGGRVIEEYGDA